MTAAPKELMPDLKPCPIKSALENIFSYEINNIQRRENSHVYSSPAPHKSCINFKVRHEPKFIYHDLGKYLVAYDEKTGFVGSYEYNPRTTDGFAGREFILDVTGKGVVFPNKGITKVPYKGTLWDTAAAKKAADEFFGIKTVSVAYKSISSRYDVYCAAEMDTRVFEEIIKLAGYSINTRAEPPCDDARGETFQARVKPWMDACFGAEISADKIERNHRFLEEALELVQANGCTQSEAHQLVDYVYGRDVGEINQEVGGVMVTLAALCLANGIDMHKGGETELARIWTKVEKIRAKQAAKPKHSPLPEHTTRPAPISVEVLEGMKKPVPVYPEMDWNLTGEELKKAVDAQHRYLSESNQAVIWNAALDAIIAKLGGV
jgi:NTP pyrophosphatase (non-canonical NTP hydrolase)